MTVTIRLYYSPPGLPVDVPIEMSVDDHPVSALLPPLAPPRDVVFVPQIQRVALKLHPGAGAEFVVDHTVDSCKHFSQMSNPGMRRLTSWWGIGVSGLGVVSTAVPGVDGHGGLGLSLGWVV